MKGKRGRWLDMALRAQQARTLDHKYRVHETRATHEQALQQESDARQDLSALASAWRERRGSGQFPGELDRLYQRFHAQLRAQAAETTDVRVWHEQALGAAVQQLKKSHSLEQGLDGTIQRRNELHAKATLTKERNMAGEAWLLSQAGKKGSE